MDIVPALLAEIASLERELASDPRYKKLRDLRNVLVHYPGANSVVAALRAQDQHTLEVESRRVTENDTFELNPRRKRKRDPQRLRAIEEAVNFVRSRPGLTTTAAIYDHLVELGIQIGGQNPAGNLSAMLYKDGGLISHGRAGWTFGPKHAGASEGENVSEENEASDDPPSDASEAELDDESRKLIHGD